LDFRLSSVSLDPDPGFLLPLARKVERQLHPHQVIHLGAKRLLDPQSHLGRQVGALVQEQRQGLARNAQDARGLRDRQTEGLDKLTPDHAAGVRGILHGHRSISFLMIVREVDIEGIALVQATILQFPMIVTLQTL
jgi:hypothetical protein